MMVETERFGSLELKDKKILSFPSGLPGFEGLHEFIILEVSESKPLFWLQSVEDKYVSLPVIIPFQFIEDYYIGIRDHELDDLKVENESDLLILNVVVIPSDVQKMTVNLAAPIIVNVKTGLGKQLIIDATDLPVRFPIYDAIMSTVKGEKADVGTVQENR